MTTNIPTPDETVDSLSDAIGVLRTTIFARIETRDRAIASVIRGALPSADPFPLLRALVADLGGESAVSCSRCGDVLGPEEKDGTCEPAPPPTQPGPTERTDMALRFRYHDGCFVVPNADRTDHIGARPHHFNVRGLRVRIVYEHTPADREAALVCAESWQGRMMQAGAREVVVVGEVVK